MPRVAAVVVTYNSGDDLARFLDSVTRSNLQPGSVIVVENHSAGARDSEQTAREYDANWLGLPENIGYGSAMNRGAKAAHDDAEYLLLCNPDLVVEPGAVEILTAWLDEHPEVAAAGPRILSDDGTVYPSARAIPSLTTGIGHALLSPFWPQNPWSRRYRADSDYSDEPRDAGWLSGACILVRRDVFESLQGFDEGYFMYFEDVDLGYRLAQAGWKISYVPQAVVRHSGAGSTHTESERMLRIHHESAYRFIRQRYAGWWRAPLRLVIRLGLSLRFQLERRRSRA